MVQAKTSDFQPLPLKILNVLSLLAGASLLVAVSWEILLGDPRHYSTDYLLLQGIVCVVFLADFFARMWMADHSWRFFFRNLYFFLLSVPYLNIVDWMGIELSHAEAMRLVSENSSFYYQISSDILFCIRVFRHSITMFDLSE